ncbi:amidohydrolase family protein [Micromonospora radicis]|uniref:Amidohydrolase n=1 Tax=Micromonospora radicis TaxID=1894971 RepID=A0A418MZ56_9ACTN|nr:amidohydrolase family protein [Micromonospora radicis]RIV40026.1 amidohydrolase [Micromonospora radicis]
MEQHAPVIDVHAHALPTPFLADLQRRGLADLSLVEKGTLHLDAGISGLAPGAAIPFPAEQYDLARRLAAMEATGVDHQAVSAPPFVFASAASDPGLAADLARRSNDALAEFVAGSRGRLVALATVPVGTPDAAGEAVRALDDLGAAGLVIGTFGGGRELDHDINEELWQEVARRRAFVLVHPSRASEPARLRDFHLVQLAGFPMETALAISRLIFAGVLDRHDLRLCLSHGGGCLPGLAGRLDLGWDRKAVAHTSLRPPSEYLRRLYYDTALFSPVILRRLIEDVTADRVCLGTDTPFDVADLAPIETVRGLGLPPDQAAAVLGGTAARLLGGHLRRIAEVADG